MEQSIGQDANTSLKYLSAAGILLPVDPEPDTVVLAELVSVTKLDELEAMSSDICSEWETCVLKYH